MLWEVRFDDQSTAPAPGTEVKEGATLANIEASYAIVPLTVVKGGKLIDTCVKQGQMVKKGDVVGWVE
jgi:biotin carboxyl carrier protein